MVRVPDLKSSGPGFKLLFRLLAGVVLSGPRFNFLAMLVNS